MRLMAVVVLAVLVVAPAAVGAQSCVLREVSEVKFPGRTDCNSPAHWDGETMYVLNSAGHPSLTHGKDQFSLGEAVRCEYDNEVKGGRWIECTWRDDDGTIYGWYHHEPHGLCPGTRLTAPKIGAAKSTDNGLHWTDLGIVLEAPPNTLDCTYKNGFFAGGNGDFSAMLDHHKQYLYIFFSTYWGSVSDQGVAVARMRWSDRNSPAGKVWKYHAGKWQEPGIGGRQTPIWRASISWKEENADALWGPSIHWNTYLNRYVILLNRTRYKPGWPQEGIYISYGTDLSDVKTWSEPKRIMEGGSWYPQVLGIDTAARETDKLCGKVGRLYIHGTSKHEIVFLRDGES